jgi:hypothetical protein
MKEDFDSDKFFISQAYILQEAIYAFGDIIQEVHTAYEDGKYLDWPTVLLSTLLQTTAGSLYTLLPKGEAEESNEIVDRRSIASLIRNIVDTHDTIDLLCNVHQSDKQFNLHRDIMGYYLSGRLHKFFGSKDGSGLLGIMHKSCDWYWGRICKALPDETRRKKLKSQETLFYKTRKERLERSCGEHANRVGKILADLSSYVHSIPPSIWMKTLDEAFKDNKTTRGVIGVWLRIANFFYARSIDIILTAVNLERTNAFLNYYIEFNQSVFAKPDAAKSRR